jgi:ribosomal protein L25 (general stress protein Ctc)
MEIKDNTFSRQFETFVDSKLISVEYSFQEKKIFLTRINVPDGFVDEDFLNDFLKRQ